MILEDAASQNLFSADPYLVQRRARSILCLPLVNQSNLIGVLYLENNLAPRVFAPARIAVLKLLASQAAMALENTGLYRDLAQREAKIRRLVDANIVGLAIFGTSMAAFSRPMTRFFVCSDTSVRISSQAVCAGPISWLPNGSAAIFRTLSQRSSVPEAATV